MSIATAPTLGHPWAIDLNRSRCVPNTHCDSDHIPEYPRIRDTLVHSVDSPSDAQEESGISPEMRTPEMRTPTVAMARREYKTSPSVARRIYLIAVSLKVLLLALRPPDQLTLQIENCYCDHRPGGLSVNTNRSTPMRKTKLTLTALLLVSVLAGPASAA